MSAHLSDVEAVREAAQAVGRVLGDQAYAIIGGAGCALLGSPGTTTDVGIVVPMGQTTEIRKLFKAQEGFVVEKRTLHTYFSSNPRVDIEILTPPMLFKEEFDASTPTVRIGYAKVLKPALLLNAKCHSIMGRGAAKTRSDAHDIAFLLRWYQEHGDLPKSEDCPRVTREFLEWYIQHFGGEEDWRNNGFDSHTR
jgi:hypothetical protein